MTQGRVIPIIAHAAWEAAICARCIEPGHCCKRFHLSTGKAADPNFWEPFTCWDHLEARHSVEHFKPVERIGQWTAEDGLEGGRTYSAWAWSCTALGADGRCTIYNDRPDLCRRYEPLTDHLCVMTPGGRP